MLACKQQITVGFAPLPPGSPGRPLRSRHRSEKPDKHVRLVPLAPGVTVAEWLRRQTVDLSTRVQFPPVTPIPAGVVQRIEHFGPNEAMPVGSRPPVPVRVGVAPLDESAGFRNSRPLVRFQPLTPDFEFRGPGKRINPLGLEPRESRFESEVPDQFLWGSQAARQLAVNQFIAGSNPAPTANDAGLAFLSRALSCKEVQ
jgi:hypothetical protein